MIKDHYLVGRSERSEVRHGKPNEILCVGLRFAHSDLQFVMTIYHLGRLFPSIKWRTHD